MPNHSESMGHKIGIYQYDETSTEADNMEKLGDVIGLSGIKFSADTLEDKPYDEGANDWDEFATTMKRMEEFTLTCRRDKDTATNNNSDQSDRLFDPAELGGKLGYKFVLPAPYSKKILFDAILASLEIKTETRTRIEFMLTLKPSGEPTISAVS